MDKLHLDKIGQKDVTVDKQSASVYYNNSLFKTNANLKDNLQNFPTIFI